MKSLSKYAALLYLTFDTIFRGYLSSFLFAGRFQFIFSITANRHAPTEEKKLWWITIILAEGCSEIQKLLLLTKTTLCARSLNKQD